MSNKEIVSLKEEMAEMLALQSRRLRELEAKLHQEQMVKASLESDYQHLLDQLQFRSSRHMINDEQAVICG